jgi:hypothetical protein
MDASEKAVLVNSYTLSLLGLGVIVNRCAQLGFQPMKHETVFAFVSSHKG